MYHHAGTLNGIQLMGVAAGKEAMEERSYPNPNENPKKGSLFGNQLITIQPIGGNYHGKSFIHWKWMYQLGFCG
jgi:hypothetical protein